MHVVVRVSYCSQMLSKDVDECVTTLLKELVRFQDRLYQKDPMKARMKRRLVMGLREVLKHLKLRKVKCVIISPNCERIQSKGILFLREFNSVRNLNVFLSIFYKVLEFAIRIFFFLKKKFWQELNVPLIYKFKPGSN